MRMFSSSMGIVVSFQRVTTCPNIRLACFKISMDSTWPTTQWNAINAHYWESCLDTKAHSNSITRSHHQGHPQHYRIFLLYYSTPQFYRLLHTHSPFIIMQSDPSQSCPHLPTVNLQNVFYLPFPGKFIHPTYSSLLFD